MQSKTPGLLHASTLTALEEAPMRVQAVYHLNLLRLHGNAMLPEALLTDIRSDLDEISEALHADNTLASLDDFFDYLFSIDPNTVLIHVGTPIPQAIGEDGYSYNWSAVKNAWFSGDDLEQACQVALAWQAEYIRGCKSKRSPQKI